VLSPRFPLRHGERVPNNAHQMREVPHRR
jgi:hypothetical protein